MTAKVASSFRRPRTNARKGAVIIRYIALRTCLGRDAGVGHQSLQLLGFPFQGLGPPQAPLAIPLQGDQPSGMPKIRSLGALSHNIP
jgi:hypothetical protein